MRGGGQLVKVGTAMRGGRLVAGDSAMRGGRLMAGFSGAVWLAGGRWCGNAMGSVGGWTGRAADGVGVAGRMALWVARIGVVGADVRKTVVLRSAAGGGWVEWAVVGEG